MSRRILPHPRQHRNGVLSLLIDSPRRNPFPETLHLGRVQALPDRFVHNFLYRRCR